MLFPVVIYYCLDVERKYSFGKEIVNEGGLGSCLLNVLWFFFGGLEMALENMVIGGILCLTVVGIPFGLQFFKIAKLSFSPFGARVVKIGA